jgi:NAD(P)-dependent dehydrogenase (short-subunit alcohol dehydrogenase family)
MGQTNYDFSRDTVIVTGGSSGIGRGIALAFGDAGATVVNADIQSEPKDVDTETPTHESIEENGGTAEYVETDVSDPGDLAAVVEAARAYGGVDVMVNNAGVYANQPLRETTSEEFETLYQVNARGTFFGCKVAANDMIDRGEPGAIVNTASISSNVAQFGQVLYDSTKGAVRMITRGAALELAEHGIRVNAVAPGAIATEFFSGWTEEAIQGAERDDFIKEVPLGRAGYPEDVADGALFLASDAAGYTTGELLSVDGGWQIY